MPPSKFIVQDCCPWLYVAIIVQVTQSCPTLCDPVHYSPPGSSVDGIFWARIVEWVAISSSRGFSQSKDQTQVSCIAGKALYHLGYKGSPKMGSSPLDHQGSPYSLNVARPNWVKIQNIHWISKINMKIRN